MSSKPNLFGEMGKPCSEGWGIHDPEFKYLVSSTVVPDSFDPDRRVEGSHGIHFFITRAEAEEYS